MRKWWKSWQIPFLFFPLEAHILKYLLWKPRLPVRILSIFKSPQEFTYQVCDLTKKTASISENLCSSWENSFSKSWCLLNLQKVLFYCFSEKSSWTSAYCIEGQHLEHVVWRERENPQELLFLSWFWRPSCRWGRRNQGTRYAHTYEYNFSLAYFLYL
jgi:hypothetical protein